jgi:glyoxylase-like metal-dependent hydrolase (beta-lactamase superfamily II)
MMNNGPLVSLFLCFWLYSLTGCSPKQSTYNDIDSKKVDSLIRVQRINSRTLLVNFGYDAITGIVTEQGIVIVDAGISTDLTGKYRKLIEDAFHKDFIYVINTHGHHDHIGGNSVFPEAKFVGHINFPADISERWTNPSKSMISLGSIIEDYEQQLHQSTPDSNEWYDIFTQKIRYMSAYSDVKNRVPARLPDITFSDSMTIELGDTVFKMIYFGKSHSESDIVIYVPELKLIFTGDLFSKYGRPGINSSATDEIKWIRATDWIQKRINRIEKVIGGHGQIMSTEDLKQFNNNILSRCSVSISK